MKKTMISELRTDRNGNVYGANAAGQVFFPSKTQKLTEGCWITYEETKQTKKRIDPALPSTPENLRDLTAEEALLARSSNRVLAVFADEIAMAKGVSTEQIAEKHIAAYVKSLDASIAAQYADAFAEPVVA